VNKLWQTSSTFCSLSISSSAFVQITTAMVTANIWSNCRLPEGGGTFRRGFRTFHLVTLALELVQSLSPAYSNLGINMEATFGPLRERQVPVLLVQMPRAPPLFGV
jgi:hypothetical protein